MLVTISGSCWIEAIIVGNIPLSIMSIMLLVYYFYCSTDLGNSSLFLFHRGFNQMCLIRYIKLFFLYVLLSIVFRVVDMGITIYIFMAIYWYHHLATSNEVQKPYFHLGPFNFHF